MSVARRERIAEREVSSDAGLQGSADEERDGAGEKEEREMMRPETAVRQMLVILEAFEHPKAAEALKWALGEIGPPEDPVTFDLTDLPPAIALTWGTNPGTDVK